MDLQTIKDLFLYNPVSGAISTRKTKRRLIPDDEGFYTLYDSSTKQRSKLKADRLCWSHAHNQELRKNQKILHKNLNTRDNSVYNLLAVNQMTYHRVMEAAKNLSGGLRLTPHPTDRFDILVVYYHKGKVIKELFHDSIAAKQRLIQLQLKFAKLLTKYCVFD